jgi:hypothetical protein
VRNCYALEQEKTFNHRAFMKNKLTLCALFSLFTGVAMHASDGYVQKIRELIDNELDDVALIELHSTSVRPSIIYVYVPRASNHPVCMNKPVIINGGMNYMLTNIAFENKRNLTQLTLTPTRQ